MACCFCRLIRIFYLGRLNCCQLNEKSKLYFSISLARSTWKRKNSHRNTEEREWNGLQKNIVHFVRLDLPSKCKWNDKITSHHDIVIIVDVASTLLSSKYIRFVILSREMREKKILGQPKNGEKIDEKLKPTIKTEQMMMQHPGGCRQKSQFHSFIFLSKFFSSGRRFFVCRFFSDFHSFRVHRSVECACARAHLFDVQPSFCATDKFSSEKINTWIVN